MKLVRGYGASDAQLLRLAGYDFDPLTFLPDDERRLLLAYRRLGLRERDGLTQWAEAGVPSPHST